MQLIKPYAKLVPLVGSESSEFTIKDGVACLRRIEWAARFSHATEDAQTDSSWERFVRAVVIGHGDWSVVEHASVSVDFLVDRGVSHELVRHRLFGFTQCLSGETRIRKDLSLKDAIAGQTIFSVAPNGAVVPNKIKSVLRKGRGEVFEVLTSLGYRLRATLAHEFSTRCCYKPLAQISPGESINVNGRPCLLTIDDLVLTEEFRNGLCPQEISDKYRAPYSSVTRRLRFLGIHNDRCNDKNPEKYSKNHTVESYARMRASIRSGYEAGRKPWNFGRTRLDTPSIQRMADANTFNPWKNGFGLDNTNWKGGSRAYGVRKKKSIKICELCSRSGKLEVYHRDEDTTNNSDENLIKLCLNCHKKIHCGWWVGTIAHLDTVVSILSVGWEDLWDLEMEDPFANYVANGFVVHNSSTRFINYVKKIPPSFVYPDGGVDEEVDEDWTAAIESAETSYKKLIAKGWPPQKARSVFPNALSTRILVTGNLRNWRHALIMRTPRETHPQFREVTIPLLAEFKEKIPILFEDIVPGAKQSEAIKVGR